MDNYWSYNTLMMVYLSTTFDGEMHLNTVASVLYYITLRSSKKLYLIVQNYFKIVFNLFTWLLVEVTDGCILNVVKIKIIN